MTTPAPVAPVVIGIDVGGTTIKAALVDPGTGELASERRVVPTPRPATPAAVLDEVAALVADLARHPVVPVGVALPAVVRDGVVGSAANIDASWIGLAVETSLRERLGRPVVVVNDADAAGVAEATFGPVDARCGVTLVTTLGTGIGSALLVDGTLVPNTELGHLPVDGAPAERLAATSAMHRDGLSWEAWAERLTTYYRTVELLLAPDRIIVGGAVSASADRFLPMVRVSTPLVAATLGNDAGVVGAALLALRHAPDGWAVPGRWAQPMRQVRG